MEMYINRTYSDREINPGFNGNLALILLREKDGRLALEPKSVEALRPTIDAYLAQTDKDFEVLRGYSGVSVDCISTVETTLRQIYRNAYGLLSFQQVVNEEGVLKGLDELILAPTQKQEIHSATLASEASLARDWNRIEEDEAWRTL